MQPRLVRGQRGLHFGAPPGLLKVADWAGKRAQPKDIEVMEDTIRVLSKLKLTTKEYAETDVAFHNRPAMATGNPLFSVLADSINDVMIEVRLRCFSLESAWAIERAGVYHSRILDRVMARDPEAARHAMEEDFANSRQMLRRAARSLRTSQPCESFEHVAVDDLKKKGLKP